MNLSPFFPGIGLSLPRWIKFSRSLLCFMFIFMILITGSGATEPYLDSVKAERMITIQNLLFSDEFHAADMIATAMINDAPSDPAGYLFRGAVMIGWMVDREEADRETYFFATLDTVNILADKFLEKGNSNTSAWMCLLKGHACVYRALWESRFGGFAAAIRSGINARREYERGLAFDSTLYDLYFGLGNYHYWKSVKAGILKWIGIFKNERQKGIDELRLAADSSVVSRVSSRNAFIWLFLNEKLYDSAVAACGDVVNGGKIGKTLQWPMAEAYFKGRKYQKALKTYQAIRQKVARDPGNYYNLVECDYRIYRCLEKMNQKEQAKARARKLLSYYDRIPKKTRSRQRTNIKFLRRAARV